MPSSIRVKSVLRAEVRAQAAALPPEVRRESDRALAGRFLALPQVEEAETLLLFRGVGTEPDTLPILEALWRAGKRVLLPKCLPGRAMAARAVTGPGGLVPGAFGIPEPGEDCPEVEKGRIDLILVPALCYDRARFRLGQGGGYYDRYLADYRGETVGLCRNALLRERLPAEPHDRPVGLVLTETERFCV